MVCCRSTLAGRPTEAVVRQRPQPLAAQHIPGDTHPILEEEVKGWVNREFPVPWLSHYTPIAFWPNYALREVGVILRLTFWFVLAQVQLHRVGIGTEAVLVPLLWLLNMPMRSAVSALCRRLQSGLRISPALKESACTHNQRDKRNVTQPQSFLFVRPALNIKETGLGVCGEIISRLKNHRFC